MPDTELAHLVDSFMRRIHAGLRATAHDFDKQGVGPNGGIVLLTLAEIEPTPMLELANRLVRDKSQMTRSVQFLESKGLINRSQSNEDARIYTLSLTGKGRKTVAELQTAVGEVIDDILAPLTSSETRTLKSLMRKVANSSQV